MANEFDCPQIVTEDVALAAAIMSLPDNAFNGQDGNDPRKNVLLSNESIDVEACPGSGKTTLLVAKLALLAGKWIENRRGICVLSHTNVARDEIENRLGNSKAGRSLLTYPHFVGTIHGFVNEFIAMPWLRSKGIAIKMIDDESVRRRRWFLLDRGIRQQLERNRHGQSLLVVNDFDYGLGEVRWGRGKLGVDTPTYKAMQLVCKTTSEEGYFCHDEMLLWASEAIQTFHGLVPAIQSRFPVLFVDEVQDNSPKQSSMIEQIFGGDNSAVICQRFGDSNQAIYNRDFGENINGEFPRESIRIDLPNSHRFDNTLAEKIDRFAVNPQNLAGCSQTRDSDCAVLLFDDDTIGQVLPNFCHYLANRCSTETLDSGLFCAVGAVHRYTGADHLPRSVRQYWDQYSEANVGKPRITNCWQYLSRCKSESVAARSSQRITDALATSILHLAALKSSEFHFKRLGRSHIVLLKFLTEKNIDDSQYLDTAIKLSQPTTPLDLAYWEQSLKPQIVSIAESLAGTGMEGPEVGIFLDTSVKNDSPKLEDKKKSNLFRYSVGENTINVRVGSIHSVKGETHTATLVLETYYKGHHLKSLKPWILGKRSGGGKENATMQARLKQHYVALSRPSDIVCLAMRQDSFKPDELETLKQLWRTGVVQDGGAAWMY